MLINKDRAVGIMKDFNVDALLGTTPVNLAYLSDFRSWLHWFYRLYTAENFMFQNYALFPRDQSIPPALIPFSDPAGMGYNAQWPSWIEDVYPFGLRLQTPQPEPQYPPHLHRLKAMLDRGYDLDLKTGGQAIVRAMRDRGLTRGVVGVDKEGMKPEEFAYVQKELPDVQFKEAGELFRFIRMAKSPEEIALLRKSAEINEHGFEALLEAAVPGATEFDLTRTHRATVSSLGAVPVFCNNTCGPYGTNHWEPTDYALKLGDTVYCDAGCTYQYYHADGNINGVLGADVSPRQRDLFNAQVEGIENAKAAIRPGAKVSQVLDAFRQGVLKSGAVKNFLGFGHAIGLEARDMPMIQSPFWTARDDFIDINHGDITLESGMVFNLEDAYREVPWGTIALEVSLVVTSNGCEPLIRKRKKVEALPA